MEYFKRWSWKNVWRWKKKTKNPDKILKIVEEIFNFNKKIQEQPGHGLKLLTPDQMLSRLPILLA